MATSREQLCAAYLDLWVAPWGLTSVTCNTEVNDSKGLDVQEHPVRGWLSIT